LRRVGVGQIGLRLIGGLRLIAIRRSFAADFETDSDVVTQRARIERTVQ
jgi:hypothetical protein